MPTMRSHERGWSSTRSPMPRTRWRSRKRSAAPTSSRLAASASGGQSTSWLAREHERAAEARAHLLGRDPAVAVGVERGEHGGRAAPLLAGDEAVAVEVVDLEEVVRGLAGLGAAAHRGVALAEQLLE